MTDNRHIELIANRRWSGIEDASYTAEVMPDFNIQSLIRDMAELSRKMEESADLSVPHCQRKCKCSGRIVYVRVKKAELSVFVPDCVTLRTGRVQQEAIEYVSGVIGQSFVDEDGAYSLYWAWIPQIAVRVVRMGSGELSDSFSNIGELSPACGSNSKRYYWRRDVLSLISKDRRLLSLRGGCHVCGAMIDGSTVLSCGKWCCVGECADKYSREYDRWRQKQIRSERAKKRQLKEVRDCEKQMKALRKYLKTGSLDAFQSLPKELRPESTLLDS